ncbi:MAG: ComEC/Rec2 family competence protein [Candidatus Woesebacteria bacterium]|nr:ComEC/Rec2 family competence protein [Candidatus Woesebacteria bacterium]
MRYQSISFLVLIFIIFLRFNLTKPIYKNGDFVKITSKVYNEPIVYDRQQYLKLQGLNFYLPKYPSVTYGDNVVVTGQINNNKLVSPKLVEIKSDKKGLYSFRQKLINFYKSSLPEPYASLVAGTVIGSKNMPEDFWNKLKATGTAHIVVASGTNVTMTAAFLIGLLTVFLKRRVAIWITMAGIFAYVVISGFDAPIIRAGIMGSILLIGQEKGRLVNSWRILIYSGLIMLLIKPTWITDLGFILSFTATISLMLLQKKIDNRLKIIPAFFREGLSTSLAAQVGVAPIIFVTFGQFNILSPIINALVLWTIPYIMVVGALGGIVGLIVPVLGRLILYVAFPFLLWFTKILEIFSY